jgi:hypothetical protein
MATGKYNIEYYEKTHYSQTFTFYAPPATEGASASPVNFTGFTGRMQVRPLYDDTVVMIELTTTNGMITFPGQGRVVLTIPVANAAGITTEGVYDLYVTSGVNGQPDRILEGLFRFVPSVTR